MAIIQEACSDIGQIKKKFVHLHLHTTYSLLDGAQLVGDIKSPKKEYGVLNLAQKLGMDAIAITDHGNMFGAIDFFKKAKSGGVKPLVGCETYIAPYEAQNKESHRLTGRTAYHLLLLCMNNEGYKNLSHLVTYGHFEGFYYRPRIDKAMLRKHAKGLIGTSSCLAGEICQHLIKGRDEEALAIAKEYAEIFEGRFYIELQKNGLELQEQMNPKLVKIARELGLGLVATNDVHYMTQEDAEAQDALMAIQTRKSLSDPTRLKHEVQEFYLKSPEQMWELFADYPEACENTVKIAEMCDVDILPKGYFFPRLETEAGMTNDDALAKEAQEGMEARLATLLPRKPPEKHEEIRANYQERLDYELRVVKQMGFADYFRIVADFINWAKNNDIPVGPGRGSAAGSLVAYCTRITDVDPIEHDLLFERFLNPERVSMPDIDVDFCEAQREKVIEYVRQRYAVPGGPAVSQIITFGKLKAKAVLKDVGRAMDMSFSETDRLAKLIPNVLNITLDEAIRQEPRLQQEIKNHPQVAKLFDIAKRLEGLNRHASVHAAGVVISDGRPLVEHLPLYKGSNDEVVTQFDMKGVETIGLIKFDFLGLKNLTLIKHCLEMVEKNRGQKILLDQIELEDKEVFKLLCAADTLGVFQLESSGMRQLITRLRPSCFEDVIALVALYRPGPLKSGMADSFIRRKHGEEEIDFIFDVLEPVLKSTYGVCIYQEQVMQIANILASYSLGEADLLRRAMGKKDAAEMERQRGRFLEGSEKNQHDREKAADLFGKVEKFAEYGFNRSHSAAYGLIAYQTAWLKAHYRHEYMAALLTADAGNSDKILLYLNDCRQHHVEVLPPDVNESSSGFAVIGEKIRFALAGIKGIGDEAIKSILDAREKEGPFTDLYNFCKRVDLKRVNRRVIEALIKCGAFDSLGHNRASLIAVVEDAIQYGQRLQKEKDSQQISLFMVMAEAPVEQAPTIPKLNEWSEKERLQHEKETLGFYISGHPLRRFEKDLKRFSSNTIADLEDSANNAEATIAGIVTTKRDMTTKKGDRMAFVTIEDMTGSIEISVFPRVFSACATLLESEEPLLVRGQIERDENQIRMRAEEIRSLVAARNEKAKEVHLHLDATSLSDLTTRKMFDIFQKNQGSCTTFIHLTIPRRSETLLRLAEEIKVEPTEAFEEAIESLFGPRVISLR